MKYEGEIISTYEAANILGFGVQEIRRRMATNELNIGYVRKGKGGHRDKYVIFRDRVEEFRKTAKGVL